MRFVVTGEWSKNSLLRLILFFFLVFILFFWVTNWILYFQKLSLDPASVVSYYRGDAASEFGAPPRPLGALAETSHFHLFAMGVLVMTLTHLVLFVPVSPRLKGMLTLVTFLSALFNEAAGWLVRFASPGFAVAKVACFLLLQVSLFGLLVITMIGVLRPARNGYGEPGHGGRPAPANGVHAR